MSKREIVQARRKVQMIFQDPFSSLNPPMSVGSTLAEPLLFHRLTPPARPARPCRRPAARLWLDPDMAERCPHEFSGGRRQRICIARVVWLGPKLIMAAVPVPDTAVRGTRNMAGGGIVSPVRAVDYLPPERRYIGVAPGHLVRDDTGHSLIA